jgi:branched-chain amino acid transport system permease protein
MAFATLVLLLMAAGIASAQEDTEIRGTMTGPNGQPIAGEVFEVSDTSGFSGTDTSDRAGRWNVVVPEPGQYTVALDTTTLPEGVTLTNPDRSTLTVNVFGSGRTVSFPTGQSVVSGESTLDRFLQLFVDGLVFGLFIALAGVGLSMIFGTTGLTNFSHGEIVTFGALLTYFGNNVLSLPFVAAVAFSVLASGAFGAVQDLSLWRPLRRRGISLIAMLVVSIGFGILLRYVYLFFFGGETEQYASYGGQAGVALGTVDITPKVLIGSTVAIVALAATMAWLKLTRSGKASRAISDNPALASASGIHVERVINYVWIIGAALAGLAGALYSMSVGVNWYQGFQVLLLVFAGVILGGLGTAVGAIVGSLVVGVSIQVSTLVVPTEMKTVGALAIMIVILLIRPQGIMGRRERVG